MISIAVLMLAVITKKKGWGLAPIHIDALMPGFTWANWAAIFEKSLYIITKIE